MFWSGVRPPNLTFPWGLLYSTSVPTKWHLNPSNGLSTVRESDRRERQTDHATEKCVATGGIACAANNDKRPEVSWRRRWRPKQWAAWVELDAELGSYWLDQRSPYIGQCWWWLWRTSTGTSQTPVQHRTLTELLLPSADIIHDRPRYHQNSQSASKQNIIGQKSNTPTLSTASI